MRFFRVIAAVLALGVAFTGSASAAPQAKITTAVSLTAPASGPYGSTIKLSGKLWRYGTTAGVSYATVRLQRSVHNKKVWSTYKTVKTNADGTFAFSVVQSGAYDYRAYFTGSPVYTGALSPVRYPVTTQKVFFDSITTTNNTTGAMRATGRVFPAPPTGTIVYLQHWLASKWQTVGSGRTSSNAVTISLTRPASLMSYRLVVAARYPYGAGVSPTKGFANYVWRASFDRPLKGTSSGGSYSFQTTDTMYVDLPQGSSSYWLYVDTARCKRVEGVLAASSSNTGVATVTYATDRFRFLFSKDLPPDSGQVPYGANLNADENETSIRVQTPGFTTMIAVRMRGLCSN